MSKIINSKEDLQQYLNDLESRLTFQDETIEALNEMVTKQWAIIDRLEQKLKTLDNQMYDMEHQQTGPKSDPPPPHY